MFELLLQLIQSLQLFMWADTLWYPWFSKHYNVSNRKKSQSAFEIVTLSIMKNPNVELLGYSLPALQLSTQAATGSSSSSESRSVVFGQSWCLTSTTDPLKMINWQLFNAFFFTLLIDVKLSFKLYLYRWNASRCSIISFLSQNDLIILHRG